MSDCHVFDLVSRERLNKRLCSDNRLKHNGWIHQWCHRLLYLLKRQKSQCFCKNSKWNMLNSFCCTLVNNTDQTAEITAVTVTLLSVEGFLVWFLNCNIAENESLCLTLWTQQYYPMLFYLSSLICLYGKRVFVCSVLLMCCSGACLNTHTDVFILMNKSRK